MNTHKKIMLLSIVALIAFFAVGVFVTSVNGQAAAPNASFTTAVSASNSNVGDSATYTFTITGLSSANITSANVTIPYVPNNATNYAITRQPSSQSWNISYVPVKTNEQNQVVAPGVVILTSQNGQALTSGQSIEFTFNILNGQVAGGYNWSTLGINSDGSTSTVVTAYTLVITSILPALAILGIGAAIAFLNTGVNRLLIGYFVGWEQYRVMQKEMAEFRSESMAAARANDKKQMEKLKKKQSQINNMQTKMFKPQMLQIGISFIYLIVWFLVLIPTFQNISMAYLPGFGPLPVAWLYPICSIFLGLVASRIVGVMPIENV
jgi:uncharacterized membrane protein (DUF106 family)